MENLRLYLTNAFEAAHITLTDRQKAQFERYAELLCEWNEKMNLTAITEAKEIAEKHFLDSVALAFEFPTLVTKEASLIDVGTGAGFPGLPLKILYPELKLTLLDTLQKRISFLDEVVRELELKDVCTVHARAEDGARNTAHRERYDFAVSRAVANLATLSEYCLPYVKVGGCFVAYKSAEIKQEASDAARAIRLLGGAKPECRLYTLPNTEYARSLVITKKTHETPALYPRKAGTASKKPL